jgi:hypothetical protein
MKVCAMYEYILVLGTFFIPFVTAFVYIHIFCTFHFVICHLRILHILVKTVPAVVLDKKHFKLLVLTGILR